MTITSYPLSWPEGWPRLGAMYRSEGRFGKREKRQGASWASLREVTVYEAVKRVLDELERMGLGRDDVIVSTNLRTRMDGLPRSDQKHPDDPGAAVYWEARDGGRRVMAIDQYKRVQDNLAAIAATLEAMRAIERHGGAQILERAFTGFTALPAPGSAREWWDVLECRRDASPDVIRAQYRRLAAQHHPDRGGSVERMAEINAAYAKATGGAT